MAKLACHGHNYKKGSVGGIDRHNRRLGKNHSNEDIDPARTHLNMTFMGTRNLYQDCKAEVELVKKNGGRLRSDQNWLTEFTIYAPPNLADGDCRDYFQTVYDFFKERIREPNIKLAVVHMDEHTPHMHLDFMPLVRNEHGEPVRLSSKEVITRRFLLDIHDNLPKRLQAHGYDVRRGDKVKVEDKPLKGRSARRYKADAEKERKEIEKEIRELSVEWADLKADIADLEFEKENLVNSTLETEKRLKMAYTALQEVENRVRDAENVYGMAVSRVGMLLQDIDRLTQLRDEVAEVIDRHARGMGLKFKQEIGHYIEDIRRGTQEALRRADRNRPEKTKTDRDDR